VQSTFRVGSVDPTTLGISKFLRDTSPKDCHSRICRLGHDSDEVGGHISTPIEDQFIHRRQKEATRRRGLGQGESSNHTSTVTLATTRLNANSTTSVTSVSSARRPKHQRQRRAARTEGILRNLVVPIRFSDHANRKLPSVSELDILFNNIGPHPNLCPTGSIRDVFTENSYGKLDLVSTVLEWVTVPYTEAEAAAGRSGYVPLLVY
jgi:hypothetical protein